MYLAAEAAADPAKGAGDLVLGHVQDGGRVLLGLVGVLRRSVEYHLRVQRLRDGDLRLKVEMFLAT